jgi:phosphohistidine phosphatase
MKTLYVVRHAKSSWGDLTLSDFDRPLNDRGQRNAPEMAHRLLAKKMPVDAFITSTAKRAKQTATHFIKTFGRPASDLILKEQLYHAAPQVYFTVIEDISDKFKSAAIFGHNPGITEFINQLADFRIDNMPTCGIVAFEANVKHWSEFGASSKKFLFFDSPKNTGSDD